MAFKIAQKPTFVATVTVEVANDKGGVDRNTFKAKFNRPSTDDLAGLGELTHLDMLRKQMVGWSEVTDAEGADVPFDADTLEGFLQIPAVILPTVTAFWDGVRGGKAKN